MSSAHAHLPEYRFYGSTALRRSRDGAAALTGCIVALGAAGIFAVTAGKVLPPTPSAPPAMMFMRVMEEITPEDLPPADEELQKILAEDSEFDIPEPEPEPAPKREAPRRKQPPAPVKEAPRESAAVNAPAGEISGSSADAAAVAERRAEGELRSRLLDRLIAEIEKRKKYPRQARRSGAEGTCTLEIRVDAAGVVQGCGLAKGSGSPVLDAATSRLAGRLAGMDTGVRGKAFRVLIPVRYSLRDN